MKIDQCDMWEVIRSISLNFTSQGRHFRWNNKESKEYVTFSYWIKEGKLKEMAKGINILLYYNPYDIQFIQFSSITQSCLTLCDPMNRTMSGLPVHHQLLESTQTHVHRVGDAIQPSHPLSSPSPPATNPSQHQGLFQWVNSAHEVAKVLEFQLQHQSFQWKPRTDLL